MAQHAIIEVRFGRMSGTRLVLAPGETVRIGRTDRADLVLAHDAEVSGLHAEIHWDGEQARFADLGSAGGTLLDGAPSTSGLVSHGSWLRLGQTVLVLSHEDHTPPRSAPAANAERAALCRNVLSTLRTEPRLYAVLDAARAERILVLLGEAIDESRSLYEGAKGEGLREVAPHLVRFDRASGLLDRLVHEGWGDCWGVYFSSAAGPREVRRHLRRFLMVERELTREKLYFRYYDPRVLRAFWPMATVLQRSDLFGPIERYFAEGAEGELLRFDADGAVERLVERGAVVGAPSESPRASAADSTSGQGDDRVPHS